MFNMFGKFKELQTKLKETQEKLKDIYASGESGAGMVKATVNGQKKLIKLEIDEDMIKPDDKEILQDLIIAAVNKAFDEVEIKVKQEMQNIMPNLPGMDLNNMM